MTPEQAQVVQVTWRSVLPVGGTFAELFYGRLFAVDPELKKLFRDDIVEQGRNLTAMLSVAAANVGKPERITVALRNLGKRHVARGEGRLAGGLRARLGRDARGVYSVSDGCRFLMRS